MSNNLITNEFQNSISIFPRLEVWDSVLKSRQRRLNVMLHRYGVSEGVSFPLLDVSQIILASEPAIQALKLTPPFTFEVRPKGVEVTNLPSVPVADRNAGYAVHETPDVEYDPLATVPRDVYVFNIRNVDGGYEVGNSGLGFSNTADSVTKFVSVSATTSLNRKDKAHLMSRRKKNDFGPDNSMSLDSLPLSNAIDAIKGSVIFIGRETAVLHTFTPTERKANTIVKYRCIVFTIEPLNRKVTRWISASSPSHLVAPYIMTSQGALPNAMFSRSISEKDLENTVKSLRLQGWITNETKVACNIGW